jgi:hypothetical protein
MISDEERIRKNLQKHSYSLIMLNYVDSDRTLFKLILRTC